MLFRSPVRARRFMCKHTRNDQSFTCEYIFVHSFFMCAVLKYRSLPRKDFALFYLPAPNIKQSRDNDLNLFRLAYILLASYCCHNECRVSPRHVSGWTRFTLRSSNCCCRMQKRNSILKFFSQIDCSSWKLIYIKTRRQGTHHKYNSSSMRNLTQQAELKLNACQLPTTK